MQASRHIASHSAEPGDRDSSDAAVHDRLAEIAMANRQRLEQRAAILKGLAAK